MKNPPTVWTNNRIALGMDLIFGLVVLGEEGWTPVNDCDVETIERIRKTIDHNQSFTWWDELNSCELKAHGIECEESAGFAFGA